MSETALSSAPITGTRITMAAGVLDDGHVIIATSENRNIVRSPVDAIRRAEGYELATFLREGHAEAKIIARFVFVGRLGTLFGQLGRLGLDFACCMASLERGHV